MSPSATAPIISGQLYAVDTVNGKPPADLSDFTGEGSFIVSRGDQSHDIVGVGRVLGQVVAFHEKSGSVAGKDVRVWTVTPTKDGFSAEHAPQLPV